MEASVGSAKPGEGRAGIGAPVLWRRLAAWLYESVLIFGLSALTVLFGSPMAAWLGGSSPIVEKRHVLQALLFFVLGAYFSWCWSRGQTLPMRSWRFEVVDTLGRNLSLGRAIKRYVFSWLIVLPPLCILGFFAFSRVTLYAVGLLWLALYAATVFFDPERQFLHDRLAGTRLRACV